MSEGEERERETTNVFVCNAKVEKIFYINSSVKTLHRYNQSRWLEWIESNQTEV